MVLFHKCECIQSSVLLGSFLKYSSACFLSSPHHKTVIHLFFNLYLHTLLCFILYLNIHSYYLNLYHCTYTEITVEASVQFLAEQPPAVQLYLSLIMYIENLLHVLRILSDARLHMENIVERSVPIEISEFCVMHNSHAFLVCLFVLFQMKRLSQAISFGGGRSQLLEEGSLPVSLLESIETCVVDVTTGSSEPLIPPTIKKWANSVGSILHR